MSDGDDPFARRDRTIIRPNPGGRLPQTPPQPPAAPPPPAPPYAPSQGGALPASRPTSSVAYPTSSGSAPSAAGRGRRLDGRAGGQSLHARPAPRVPPMTPAPASPHVSVDLVMVADNPLMRASGLVAAGARAPARLAVARGRGAADGSGGAGDRSVRARRARRRRAGRAGAGRQIRARRHRRRHRAEPADRGSPRLDALFDAGAVFRRAHRRRQILPGARPRQAEPRRSTSACWS